MMAEADLDGDGNINYQGLIFECLFYLLLIWFNIFLSFKNSLSWWLNSETNKKKVLQIK